MLSKFSSIPVTAPKDGFLIKAQMLKSKQPYSVTSSPAELQTFGQDCEVIIFTSFCIKSPDVTTYTNTV